MTKLSSKELLLVFIDSFVGLEYKHKKQLFTALESENSIRNFIASNKEYIQTQIGENEYNTLLTSANDKYLEFVLNGLDKQGVGVVTIESENYPQKLKDTSHPPLVLYYKGDISLLNTLSIGMVGSRKALPFQTAVAQRFCAHLSECGFTLVTGTAEGIDSVALKLAESGAKVISVMASGFNNIYPACNKNLLDNVIKNGGLVITEHVGEIVAKPFHFPIRNRIIAGLSDGVVVASAKIKSGTMYTAEYAIEYGRHLFAIPHSVGVESGAGCNELIKRGAILADCPEDVSLVFNKTKVEEQPKNLSNEEKQIISLLKEGEMHIERISEKLSMPTFIVSPILSILEIKGEVVKTGINVFGLIK